MEIDPSGLGSTDLYKLLTGIIVPRPIAWISTVGETGVYNLAPFSYFTGISSKPPTLCVSISRKRDEKKDTLRNLEWAGDFVVNIVDETLAEKMNLTSADYPPQTSEFDEVGLTPVPGDLVKSPLVREAPISLECQLLQTIEFGHTSARSTLVIGEIIRMHIRDELYANGRIDNSRLKAVGRLGGEEFCRTTDTFSLKRPKLP